MHDLHVSLIVILISNKTGKERTKYYEFSCNSLTNISINIYLPKNEYTQHLNQT